MPSIINSDNGVVSGSSGLKTTGGNDGITAFQQNGTESARIDSSGNVGIGTSSPASYGGNAKTLQVSASQFPNIGLSATASSTGNKNYRWIARDDSAGGPIMQFQTLDDSYGSEQNIWYVSRSTTGITFQSWYTGAAGSNAERMRIDSSGNVMFRNTGSTAPWDQNTAGQGAYAWLGNSTYTLGACNQNNIVGIFNRYQGNGVVIEIKNGTTVVGSISHNGTNTAFNTSSDYRLKENVQPMTGALEKVAALKPCTYTWKVDGSAGEGFIAHELAEVCPGAVTGEKDAVKEDGAIDPQGIDTSFLVATLTAAIQEQQQMIETLQAEVAELKAKV